MRKAIQALIVVVILLSCSGIFLLFVGKVHEAATRMQCNNNLKQIGIAVANYRATYNERFPEAAMPNPDLPPEKRLSWLVDLIPYVEANNIYSRMDKKKSWNAEDNRFAAEIRFLTFRCPGDPMHQSDNPLVPTSYVGISGIGSDAIALPREDRRAGIFGYDRPVKLEELKRGISETLVAVETSQTSGAWTAGGSPTTRGLTPDGSTYIGKEGQFGGNHRGGTNATFADGSVRFIEQSIDPAVWEAMATLSGKGNQE